MLIGHQLGKGQTQGFVRLNHRLVPQRLNRWPHQQQQRRRQVQSYLIDHQQQLMLQQKESDDKEEQELNKGN